MFGDQVRVQVGVQMAQHIVVAVGNGLFLGLGKWVAVVEVLFAERRVGVRAGRNKDAKVRVDKGQPGRLIILPFAFDQIQRCGQRIRVRKFGDLAQVLFQQFALGIVGAQQVILQVAQAGSQQTDVLDDDLGTQADGRLRGVVQHVVEFKQGKAGGLDGLIVLQQVPGLG